MALNATIKELKELLHNITTDIEKAENGNKAASQRVRTGTVKLEKVAKLYRKESIHSEKQPRSGKKSTSSHAKRPAAKTASRSKAASHSHGHSSSHHKAAASKHVKAKPKAAVAKARPRPLSVKRPTAKLPSRSLSFR